jgi:hypothetical protein
MEVADLMVHKLIQPRFLKCSFNKEEDFSKEEEEEISNKIFHSVVVTILNFEFYVFIIKIINIIL